MATPSFGNPSTRQRPIPANSTVPISTAESPGGLLTPSVPSPATSWIGYQCFIRIVENDHIVRHKPLSGNVSVNVPSALNPLGNISAYVTDTPKQTTLPHATDTDDIFQRLCSPSVAIWLIGYAERMGYPINAPRLVQYAGYPVTQKSQTLNGGPSGAIGGVPQYSLSWAIEYVITRPPQTMPLPGSPVLGVNGSLISPPFNQSGGDSLGLFISGN